MAKHSRTKERRATKKAKRNGLQESPLIPGVPGFVHGGIARAAKKVGQQFGSNPFGDDPQAVADLAADAAALNLTVEEFMTVRRLEQQGISSSVINDLIRGPSAPSTGGFPPLPPSFRPGELQHMQQQLALEKQLGEATLKVQQGQLELNKLQEQHAHAIATGQLQLARQMEARIAAMEKRQFNLKSFIQQQQLQLDSQLGSAQGLAGIGRDVGNQSVQRQQFLSNLAANPRDFEQLQIALGGGSSFLDAISQGQRPEGQGINRAQENLPLGQGFLDLLSAVTARPEDAFFQQAAEGFQNIQPPPTRQFAHGGKLVTDEPIVGMGINSGQARFTLGEPNAQFPQGAPEELNITPLTSPPGAAGGVPVPGPQPPIREEVRGIAPLPTGGPLAPPPAPMSLDDALAGFGDTTFTTDLLRASQQPGATFTPPPPPPAPLSPGQQVAQMMSALQPIDFFSMLPSARAKLESRISALAFSPEDTFAEFLRNLPTGPNPNAVSFGSFRHGGRVATRVA